MSDDPHPCKVTSFIRKISTLTASAVQLQEQNVSQIISDDIKYSSILILGAENIAAFTLNQNKITISDDLRPYLIVPNNRAQRLRTAIGGRILQTNRVSLH